MPTLKPYQIEGVEFALRENAPNVMIADEMGLGKTAQAIEVINRTTPNSVLIVCPASLKINWFRELELWLRYYYTIGIACGKTWPDSEINIVNYDILKNFNEINKEWDLIIFDESHYMKNTKAKRTKLALKIPSRKRIFLSGTPIVNRPIDLYPVLQSCYPKSIKSYKWYAEKFCNAYYTPYGLDVSGASNMKEFNQGLKKFMIRRLKKDVLKELPDKIRQVIELPAGRKLLKAEREAMEGRSYEDTVADMDHSVADFQEMAQARHETSLAKIPAVVDFVKDALESSEKIVVFAHHRDVIAELDKALGVNTVVVHGGCSQHKRQWCVDQFQNNEKVRVFIGNIQAAGVGLTLTAASHVIFAELDWVPGNMAQAEDRCHRIGQEDSVLIQHLVLEGSLDAYMAKILIKKQAVLDAALN